MPKKRIFFIVVFSLLSFYLNGQTSGEMPVILKKALCSLEKKVDKKVLKEFENMNESSAVSNAHFGIGQYIRNNMLRSKDKKLKIFFEQHGILGYDDISNILLLSLHRKLNHKPIDLDGQIMVKKKKLSEYESCVALIEERSKQNYIDFYVLDTIELRFESFIKYTLDSSAYRAIVIVDHCPDRWIYDKTKDVCIQAIIVSKYIKGNDYNFKIKVLSIDKGDVKFNSEQLVAGNIYDLPIWGVDIRLQITNRENHGN